MRERTTWDRVRISKDLKKIAEDPRAMNQDHLKQQPAADKYLIGGPSEFAEDVHGDDWKAEYDSDGTTERNEIGMPEMRGETFNKNDKAPGESPKRASLDPALVKRKAELCTKIARAMLPKTASELMVEDQAVSLMDLPDANLMDTYNRLAADQDDEEGDEDEGQSKQAQDEEGDDDDKEEQQAKQAKSKKAQDDEQDDDKEEQQAKQAKSTKSKKAQDEQQDDDDDAGEEQQAKQAGEIPPQFKENIEKMKDKAKDKKDDGDDDSSKKEAKKAQDEQQDDEADSEEQQAKQAKKADDEEGDEDEEVQQAAKQAAVSLIQIPEGAARTAAIKAVSASIVASKKLGSKRQAQVEQLVQQACMTPMGQGTQQQQTDQMADDQLLDQMLQDEGGDQQQQQMMMLAEGDIQMDSPSMDVGDVSLGAEDAILSQVFASGIEVQNAMKANNLQGIPNPETTTVTASAPKGRNVTASRKVGTQPSSGVSQLGGGTSPSQGSDDINTLSQLWGSAPDVSDVFNR